MLDDAGVLASGSAHAPDEALASVADGGTRGDDAVIGVLIEPGRPRVDWELLGAAAALAAQNGGRVVAVGLGDGHPDAEELGRRGADELLVLDGAVVESDVAAGLADWCRAARPWAVLVAGTCGAARSLPARRDASAPAWSATRWS